METQFRLQSTAAGGGGGGGVVNSVARPLLMPSPGAGPNSTGQSPSHHRQSRGSIPAYFPETFKDFFSMLTEDEDHGEVITNLLEDKVIPRSPKSTDRDKPRKRCDKPFCCHNSSGGGDCGGGGNSNSNGPAGCGIYLDSPAYSGGGLTRTLSSKYYRRRPSQPRLLPGTGGGDAAVSSSSSSSHLLDTSLGGNAMTTLNTSNFGRSNSFRLHRPVPSAASTYSSYLSYQQVDRSSHNNNNNNNNLTACKHVQYCCLHERDQQQERRSGTGFQQSSLNSSSSNPVAPSCSTLSLNERGTATGRLLPRVSQQQQHHQHHHHHHNNPQQQNHTQDGINFSDDEKKGLIYPQLTSDSLYMKDRIDCEGGGGGVGGDNKGDTFQQHKQRYSMLTKSYDQINRSRIFGEWGESNLLLR